MIEDYLLYLRKAKGRAPGSCRIIIHGLQFFYTNIMNKPIDISFSFASTPRKLPTVLTKEHVWKIICVPSNLKHRLILMTTYAAGLRAGEVSRLTPDHIDRKRMLIKVVGGKGQKDRYTMLSKRLLTELRRYYKACKPQIFCPWIEIPYRIDHKN